MNNDKPKMTLYHFASCPYCLMVRREVQNLNLEIPLKDIRLDGNAFNELMKGGGDSMVPCLLIERENGEVEWMYESVDIVRFLRSLKEKPE